MLYIHVEIIRRMGTVMERSRNNCDNTLDFA